MKFYSLLHQTVTYYVVVENKKEIGLAWTDDDKSLSTFRITGFGGPSHINNLTELNKPPHELTSALIEFIFSGLEAPEHKYYTQIIMELAHEV